MRKADFGSVDGAIAGGFDDGEIVGVLGVENYAVDSFLGDGQMAVLWVWCGGSYLYCLHLGIDS